MAAQVPFLLPLLLLFAVVIDPASAFYTCKHGVHKYIWIGHSTGSNMKDKPITPIDKVSRKAKAIWAEEIKYWKSKGAAGKAAFERQMRLARIIDKNPAGINDATDWYYWPSARCESVQQVEDIFSVPKEERQITTNSVCPALGFGFDGSGSGWVENAKYAGTIGSVREDVSITWRCSQAYEIPLTDECTESVVTAVIDTYSNSAFSVFDCVKRSFSPARWGTGFNKQTCSEVGEWTKQHIHDILSKPKDHSRCCWGFAEDLKRVACYAINNYKGCRDMSKKGDAPLFDTQSVFTKATATNMIWSHRRAAGDKWDNSGLSSGTDQASVDSRQGAADELSNHLSLVRASPREKDDADKTWQSRGPTKLCMRTSLGVRRLRKVINGMVKFINYAVPFAATLTKIFQALNAAFKGKFKKALAITGDAIVHAVVDASGGVILKTVVKLGHKASEVTEAAYKTKQDVLLAGQMGYDLVAHGAESVSVTNTDPCVACMLAETRSGNTSEPNYLFKEELTWALSAKNKKNGKLRMCGLFFDKPNGEAGTQAFIKAARERLAKAYLAKMNPFLTDMKIFRSAIQNLFEFDFFSAMYDAQEANSWRQAKKDILKPDTGIVDRVIKETAAPIYEKNAKRGAATLAREYLAMSEDGVFNSGFMKGAKGFMESAGGRQSVASSSECWFARNSLGWTSDDLGQLFASVQDGVRSLGRTSAALGEGISRAAAGVSRTSARVSGFGGDQDDEVNNQPHDKKA